MRELLRVLFVFSILLVFIVGCWYGVSRKTVETKGVVFVSIYGNDTNSGIFPSSPVRSINRGIEIAVASNWNKVYVSVGVYTPGNGLNVSRCGVVITNSNIEIIGGWNVEFSGVVGYSQLDGKNRLFNIVSMVGVSNVVMKNFIIRGGIGSDNYGGGILLERVFYSLISNVIVSKNNAYYGGGICLNSSSYNTIIGNIKSNSANYGGGGICLVSSTNNTINASVMNNSANQYGGGIYLTNSYNNTIRGSVVSNIANLAGGGIFLWFSANNTISCGVVNNSAYAGGGIILSLSESNIISCSIINNSADYGGGIFLISGNGNSIVNSIITNNWVSLTNGVIQLYSETNLTISNCLIGGDGANNSVGIYEETDITGYVLMNNTFIRNKLQYLYRKYTGNRWITNNDDWVNINNTTLIDSTRGSTNNKVTNM